MAQTRERTQPEAKSPPQTSQRTPARTPSTQSNSSAPRRNWLSWLRPPLTDAPAPNGQPRKRTGGAIFKSFFGILVWFVASQVVMYVLLLVDGWLTKPGQLPPLESTHLLPENTPLLGWITPFLLIYGVVVVGLWFLLIRLNLIPRDFFGARAQAEARAQRQAGGGSRTSATTAGATTGPRKTRAQRRYADAQAKAQAQANPKRGKAAAKPDAKPAKASEAQKSASAASGAHDQEYERVREAERLRRRRQSKR